MGDLMRQIPFGELMDLALSEYENKGSVFGVRKLFEFKDEPKYKIFGDESLELPFGPAAGPHTQLAQNLIAGYVAGARFFELKTVQVIDGEDLPVSKPCILAEDEGYNVEWSTELHVQEALDEYIKGYFAIKLLSAELGLGDPDGFVFNMSVGYDLEGIKTKKIDNFIEGLKSPANTDYWEECEKWSFDNISKFKHVTRTAVENIKPKVCDSITLSTLHGCPPDEIERIATYLLKEKGLHTYIKCNPTLLGYDYARKALDSLGFDYMSFDDSHFKADLQFDDAVPMLKRLQLLADNLSLEFGVKLTNTFPVRIENKELPGEEMYMSGRSLFPLSIELANRLSNAFEGNLRISFSGGIDVRNIVDVLQVGIWPITLATTILKPGGYERLHQMGMRLSKYNDRPLNAVDLKALQTLVSQVTSEIMYQKEEAIKPKRKIDKSVPLLDCFIAPCQHGCPIGQDVPAYLRLLGEGRHLDALAAIVVRNPLPFITGTICSHNCMTKCTRHFYENAVDIRSAKLEAATMAFEELLEMIESSRVESHGNLMVTTSPNRIIEGFASKIGTHLANKRTAVIGGGPAGLAITHFLSRAGYPVTLFEKRDSLGGVVKHVIPEFRIDDTAIANDLSLVLAFGAEVRMNAEIDDLEVLRTEGFEHIVVATGAWGSSNIEVNDDAKVIDALEFLEILKSQPEKVRIGKDVVIVGGGNTAMDAARAAKRIEDVESVSIVYRRTKRFMPADYEEITLAFSEDIKFYELVSPLKHLDSLLTCEVMKLGEPDESGRRRPIATGEIKEITADTIISATGNKVSCKLVMESANDVYIIGDAKRGPATIAEAIADAIDCAKTIMKLDTNIDANFDGFEYLNISKDVDKARAKKGILCIGENEDCNYSELCLECVTVCENCVDVCPNRANVSLNVDGRPQIVHIDSMCNECGNCEAFCPYNSAPYLDKFTYFSCNEDFENSKNSGFMMEKCGNIKVRNDGEVSIHKDDSDLPIGLRNLIEAFLDSPYNVTFSE